MSDQQVKIVIDSQANLGGVQAAQTDVAKLKISTEDLGASTLRRLGLTQEAQKADAAAKVKMADAAINLGQAEEEAAGHAEHLHLNHRALHQIMNLIGKETAPELGHALAGALYGPIGAALAVGELFEMVWVKINETNKELDDMGDRATAAFADIKTNLFDALDDEVFSTDKVDKYFKHISEQASQIKQAIADAFSISKAAGEDQVKLLKAREAYELAGLKANPNLTGAERAAQELAIKNQYAGRIAGVENQGQQDEINRAKAEAAAAQAQLAELLKTRQATGGATPEQFAAIQSFIKSLPETNALRRQFEGDQRAGTIDYGKIAADAALKNLTQSIEQVKKDLGRKDDGTLDKDGDAARAKQLHAELDDRIMRLEAGIAEHQDRIANFGLTAGQKKVEQWEIDQDQKKIESFRGQLAVADAKVQSDEAYITQATANLAALKEAAEAQKKLTAAIDAQRVEVEKATAHLTTVTTEAGGHATANTSANTIAARTARLEEAAKLLGTARTGGLEGVVSRGSSAFNTGLDGGQVTQPQKQDYGQLWQLLTGLGANNQQIYAIMKALHDHTLTTQQELINIRSQIQQLSSQNVNSNNTQTSG